MTVEDAREAMTQRPSYVNRDEMEADSHPYSFGDWLFIGSLVLLVMFVVTFGIMAMRI